MYYYNDNGDMVIPKEDITHEELNRDLLTMQTNIHRLFENDDSLAVAIDKLYQQVEHLKDRVSRLEDGG